MLSRIPIQVLVLNDVGHCWFQLGDGCSRCPPMHMHVYCEEGRIGASDPVVNEKLLVIMRWRRLISRVTGAELRLAQILGACWLCPDSVRFQWWKYSATSDQTNHRGRLCHTILYTYIPVREATPWAAEYEASSISLCVHYKIIPSTFVGHYRVFVVLMMYIITNTNITCVFR